MKKGYIEKSKRKNILFLADDCRIPSGIGTMTREIMVGNSHRFNFVQLGAAINHPEEGQIFDLSHDVNKQNGIDDSSVIVYPFNGYGNPDVVRQLIEKHDIDAIIHFTDPRYWIWLYRMSSELRQKMPIFYYHIWDDLPAPHYNQPYYASCDLLMGISKQSDNIAKLVLGDGNYIDLDNAPTPTAVSEPLPKTTFIPHGINTDLFYPLDKDNVRVQAMRKRLFGDDDVEFVMLHNNRNIRRKMTSDVILSFKFMYSDMLKEDGNSDRADKLRLLLHTNSIDDNGTNLKAVISDLCPEIEHLVVITDLKFSSEELNAMYNLSDVVLNIASNEGWGLSSTEAMITGTPIINNVTGGLQDQCRFETEDGSWIKFDKDFASNHGKVFTKHGEWVKPVYPASVSLQGSVPTPYIFDDRCNTRDVSTAMREWYDTPRKDREQKGMKGREWAMSDEAKFTAEHMCNSIGNAIDTVLDNWKPLPRFTTHNVQQEIENNKIKHTGISI